MKLSVWAKKQGITYQTAWNMYKSGVLVNSYQLPTGTIIIKDDNISKQEYTVCYSRVSSSQNKSNLETQSKRIYDYCVARGWIVDESIKEIGSGLNDKRPKLLKILQEKKVTRLVVEHSDRLTRFGFNYIKTLLSDCEIVIINKNKDDESDLMQDFVSLVTCFCARLYGYRRTRRVTEQLINELKDSKKNDKKNNY